MGARKIISIILGLLIISISIISPFHLKYVCYEHLMHYQEWSLGACNAVQIIAFFYSITICILTMNLVLINITKKSK